MSVNYGDIPLIDPGTGKLPPQFIPDDSETMRVTGELAITEWDSGGVVTGEALSDSYQPYEAGGIYLARVGNRVYLSVEGLEKLSSSPNDVWDSFVLPTGFRPMREIKLAAPKMNATGAVGLRVTTSGALQRGFGQTNGGEGRVAPIQASWYCNRTFPTAPYPGTSA